MASGRQHGTTARRNICPRLLYTVGVRRPFPLRHGGPGRNGVTLQVHAFGRSWVRDGSGCDWSFSWPPYARPAWMDSSWEPGIHHYDIMGSGLVRMEKTAGRDGFAEGE